MVTLTLRVVRGMTVHPVLTAHPTALASVDVLSKLLDHRTLEVTRRYYNPRELHQGGDNLQVACWEWCGNAGAERPRHAA